MGQNFLVELMKFHRNLYRSVIYGSGSWSWCKNFFVKFIPKTPKYTSAKIWILDIINNCDSFEILKDCHCKGWNRFLSFWEENIFLFGT